MTKQLPHAEAMQLASSHSFDDFGAFELIDRAEHDKRELVFSSAPIILAVDNDLLAVFQEFADDDHLMLDIAGNAISREEIDRVEKIGFNILPQSLQTGAI